MKTIVILISLISTVALAEEPQVKLTSFLGAGNQTRSAEVCGTVSGVQAATLVRVTVDYDGNHPGVYNVIADTDGKFCVAVVTFRRTANASVRVLNSEIKSAPMRLSMSLSRDLD